MPIESGAAKWTRMLWHRTVELAFAVAVIAVLVVVLVRQNAENAATHRAAARAEAVAQCVNEILGTRAEPTSKDSAAQREAWTELQRVLLAQKSGQAAAYQQFLTVLRKTVETLTKDQATRDKNPLGSC